MKNHLIKSSGFFVLVHVFFWGHTVAFFEGAEKMGDVAKTAQLGNKVDFKWGITA